MVIFNLFELLPLINVCVGPVALESEFIDQDFRCSEFYDRFGGVESIVLRLFYEIDRKILLNASIEGSFIIIKINIFFNFLCSYSLYTIFYCSFLFRVPYFIISQK